MHFITRGIIVGLFMVGSATMALAQDGKRSRADSLRMAGNLAAAIEAYRDVYRTQGDVDGLSYVVASTYALDGQFPDSAFVYLKRALVNEDTMKPLWDADFYFLIDDPRWKDIEATQLDKLAGQVKGPFDREYARQLLQMRMREWGFRYHIMLGFRTLGPSSPILSALAKSMQEHHRMNESQLLQLLDTTGWPEISAVGAAAAYAAGNILTHADLVTRQKYLPMVRAVCEKGECDWSDYAHILDRTELESGNPQVFGTQMEMNETTGLFEPRPMIDPENVDDRRTSVGMEPIADQLKRFNENMSRDFGS